MYSCNVVRDSGVVAEQQNVQDLVQTKLFFGVICNNWK